MTVRSHALALGLAACLAAPFAHADEKRELPDYDGRPHRTTPGEVLLWVPRVVFSPVYFVTEYVIRRPLGAAVTAAEKAQLPTALYNFFVFLPGNKGGVVPVAFIDFGFSPSVGLYAFWDDAGFRGHDLRLRGSTWGPDWLAGRVTERFRFSDDLDLTLTAGAIKRPDYTFYGIGPNTREDDVSRYSAETVDARVVTHAAFFRASGLEVSAGYRSNFFGPGDFGDDPSLDEQVARGRFSEPPGYREGYRGGFTRARLTLDSRLRRGGSNSGLRLELEGERGADLENDPASGWFRYGGAFGGIWDINDSGRAVSLAVSTAFSDPIGERDVPFTELVTLGGAGLMPGFREGRLRDRSALVATLRYSWPIWIWLNGSLQAAVGNVFGEHLDGASVEDSRLSMALGIESPASRDSVFQALVGFGTETFDMGASIESLRVTVGARSGF